MRGIELHLPAIDCHIGINSAKEGVAYLISFVLAVVLVFMITKDHWIKKK